MNRSKIPLGSAALDGAGLMRGDRYQRPPRRPWAGTRSKGVARIGWPSLPGWASKLGLLVSPLALLLAWTWAAHSQLYPPQLLVAPREVLQTLGDLLSSGELLDSLGHSLYRLLLGFSIGAASGLGFGVLLALSGTVENLCGPLFHTLRQLPSLALIPLFVVLFGVEETLKIVLVAKTTFFTVGLAISDAVRNIPRGYLEVGRLYGLRPAALFGKVILPATLPAVITGMRIALTRSWMVLIAVELLAADSGLGQLMEMGRQMLRIDVVMVGVAVTGVIGCALDYGLKRIERRLLRWKQA